MEPFFQALFADRIGGLNYGKSNQIYKFEKIKRAKRQAVAERPELKLLDFGIGENDEMAPINVRAALKTEIDKIENRGYADNGIAEYKEAAARFMLREFGVVLDPISEINHCIGSKPTYAMLPGVFINPGDVTLMTVPGYPVAGTYTKYFGGEVYPLKLEQQNNFLPDLNSIPASVTEKAKLLVLNYPNSPTGALANKEFFEKVIDFAIKNKIVVVNDAAHSMLTYDNKPLSFLQIPGAKEVGIEVHSMSKGFHMIGWRLGFFAGNPLIVRALADVKDNTDSGQFMAIQKAGVVALDTVEIPLQVRAKYHRRLGKLVAALKQVGFRCEIPGGTYFLYTPSPKKAGFKIFETAEDASQFLITEKSICTVPWDDAGNYLRFSVTYLAKDEAEEDGLMLELINRLTHENLSW